MSRVKVVLAIVLLVFFVVGAVMYVQNRPFDPARVEIYTDSGSNGAICAIALGHEMYFAGTVYEIEGNSYLVSGIADRIYFQAKEGTVATINIGASAFDFGYKINAVFNKMCLGTIEEIPKKNQAA